MNEKQNFATKNADWWIGVILMGIVLGLGAWWKTMS